MKSRSFFCFLFRSCTEVITVVSTELQASTSSDANFANHGLRVIGNLAHEDARNQAQLGDLRAISGAY